MYSVLVPRYGIQSNLCAEIAFSSFSSTTHTLAIALASCYWPLWNVGHSKTSKAGKKKKISCFCRVVAERKRGNTFLAGERRMCCWCTLFCLGDKLLLFHSSVVKEMKWYSFQQQTWASFLWGNIFLIKVLTIFLLFFSSLDSDIFEIGCTNF